MSSLNFSPQGLLYLPFTAGILILIHLRNKSYWVDDFLTYLDEKFDTTAKKIALYSLVLVLAILWSLLISAIVFPVSDVDEAMTGAIRSYFVSGINPYMNDVVPHIIYTSTGTITHYGKYNYGPIDLIIYGVFYFIFSPFVGNTWWIYVTNIIFVGLIFFIMISTLENKIPLTVTFISFLFLFSWFLQDNAVLMCLFLALAWFIHVKGNPSYKYYLVTIVLTLGVLTKLYVAFVLIAYFVYIFKENIIEWIVNTIIGLITTVVVVFPFGIVNVLASIFVFQVDLNIREDYATIQGGVPTYLSLLGLKWLFIPIAIILVIIFLYLCEIYAHEELNLKLALFTTLNLVLLPSSGYAFFIIPSFFLLSQYYINYKEIHYNKKITS